MCFPLTFDLIFHFPRNGHLLTHRNKKPYECKAEGCGKSYCDARSLRRHTENHHSSMIVSTTTTAATANVVTSATQNHSTNNTNSANHNSNNNNNNSQNNNNNSTTTGPPSGPSLSPATASGKIMLLIANFPIFNFLFLFLYFQFAIPPEIGINCQITINETNKVMQVRHMVHNVFNIKPIVIQIR
jgi:hypothetical protein